MSIADETLMAYADGELDASACAAVETAMRSDPEIARRVAQYREQREKLRAAYEPELAEPVPDRLLAALRDGRPGQGRVIDLERARAAAEKSARPQSIRSRSIRSRWRYSLAASLTIGIGLAIFAWQRPDLVQERGGALVANGELENGLSDSLSGDPSAGDVRIGVSFLAKSGEYCRTFTLRESAGLACRRGERWLIHDLAQLTETGRQSGTGASQSAGYRTASSVLPPAILSAVQGQIAGDPLDRAGEQRARGAGWRPR
jgi:hypothetical protein